jgi:hypothetical protein
MSPKKAEAIVARFLSNAAGIKFGSVSITVNIHNGRVMNIVYSTTENTREAETKESDAGEAKTG